MLRQDNGWRTKAMNYESASGVLDASEGCGLAERTEHTYYQFAVNGVDGDEDFAIVGYQHYNAGDPANKGRHDEFASDHAEADYVVLLSLGNKGEWRTVLEWVGGSIWGLDRAPGKAWLRAMLLLRAATHGVTGMMEDIKLYDEVK